MTEARKIGLFALVALVVSSSIGAGIFGITTDLASGGAAGPVLIAWAIVGIGIFALSLSFNNLLNKKPELNGLFSYAEAGFGAFWGFVSGWGYWLSAWLGNVAFATILMSAVGYFFPTFEGGQNIASIIAASLVMWALTYIVNRGVEGAAVINAVVMICKLLPLAAFIGITLLAFNLDVFTTDFWGTLSGNFGVGDVYAQIRQCFMVLMWVFVGIEGASMLSSRAKSKSDVGRATVLGLITLLVIYVFASMLPYGIMTQAELAALDQPAMAYILQDVVGTWGAVLINAGLIVSILGAWLSWTMFPGETLLLMSKDKLLPKVFGRVNAKGAPTFSLVLTAALIQVFVFTFLFTEQAYNFAFSLCTAAILICYAFVGLYQTKLSIQSRGQQGEWKQIVIGLVAVGFQFWMIAEAGFEYVLLCLIAYIPGIVLFAWARRENGHDRLLKLPETVATAVLSAGGILGIVLLATGQIAV